MKVTIYNQDKKLVETLDNVTEIRHLNDGRKMVHYKKACHCCGNESGFIMQVPDGYTIQKEDENKIC